MTVPAGTSRSAGNGFRPSGRLIGAGALGLVAMIFLLQNRERVSVHVLGFEANLPIWGVLGLVLTAGIAIGYLLAGRRHRRRRSAARRA